MHYHGSGEISIVDNYIYASNTRKRRHFYVYVAIIRNKREGVTTQLCTYIILSTLWWRNNKTLNIPFVHFSANPHTNTCHNKLSKLIYYMNKDFRETIWLMVQITVQAYFLEAQANGMRCCILLRGETNRCSQWLDLASHFNTTVHLLWKIN